jgi:hypothetical protein
MKDLFDDSHTHDYLLIGMKTETFSIISTKIVNKDIYACAHCGLAMEIYDLDTAITIKYKEG